MHHGLRLLLRLLLPCVGHHGRDLLVGVLEPAAQLLAASVLLDEVEPEGARALLLVDVSHGAHVRAQDDLGVVFEEVDLEGGRGAYGDTCCFYNLT